MAVVLSSGSTTPIPLRAFPFCSSSSSSSSYSLRSIRVRERHPPLHLHLRLRVRGSATETEATTTTTQLDHDNNKNLKMWNQQEQQQLQKGIAEFYDDSSSLWENIWGDHMHHGFYDPNPDVSLSDHRSAQIRMIDEALRFSSLSEAKNVVDVGCGIGGSSRYIAAKFDAKCQGITLSPVQAQRANALASSQGLSPLVSFQVADALEQPFPDGQFDLVWSMESGEHMPDKQKFVSELARVAAPGGTIIIVTWCHRDLRPGEDSLQPWEQALLNKICNAFYLPAWCSTTDYVSLLESLSLQDIKAADWSQYVAPFWPAVIRSALTWKGLTSLLRTGWKTIRGALAMPLMIQGYQKGLIKFAIITCRKPPPAHVDGSASATT